MRETLTLQFGNASNQVADKLWHSSLSELNADKASTATGGDSTVTFRNGRFAPRAVAFCSKGGLSKAKPRSGDGASSAWDGGVQMISQEADDTQAVATPLQSRSIVEVNEFRHFDPLNNYYDGIHSIDGKIRRDTMDAAHDSIRAVLEECDSLQGVQCIIDIDSTWGGFASEVLRGFREECPSAFVCSFGLDVSYPLATQGDFFDLSKQSSRRAVNLASSVTALNELSSLFIPFSPHSHDAGALAWNCMSSVYRWPGTASFPDMLFRPNAKIMQLSTSHLAPEALFAMRPHDRVAHWDSLTTFPLVHGERDSPRKFGFQFLAIRGHSTHTLARNAGDPFDYWRSASEAHRLHSPDSLQPLAGAVASLSITDDVPKYLAHLASAVKLVDHRVVHEFTQSGMSCDGIRDLHDDLYSLSDSS